MGLIVRRHRDYHYSLKNGLRRYPSQIWTAACGIRRSALTIVTALAVAFFGMQIPNSFHRASVTIQSVPGESYEICNEQSQYLTSPWTYDALATGDQSYTVAQYEALPGYGTTLPPLPAYVASEPSTTEAAVIFAPGSTTAVQAYNFPASPILYFFEGGAYGPIGLQSVSGDEFIGGSASGYPEPQFNDGGGANGISAQNDSLDYPNNTTAIAQLSAAYAPGTSSITLSASSIPLVPWGVVMIGGHDYTASTVSGTQSNYTLTIPGGLDATEAANTPVYYDGLAGGVTVSYLDISNDLHSTTGTIYTGAGWTVTHNNIHDSYSTPGVGIGIFGGNEGTIEYNCLSKIGEVAVDIFGTGNKFDYNETFETNYEPDPGCGCAGVGKWWGTLNADISDDAFIDSGPQGAGAVWLDNGNSGTLVSGNYFDKSYGSAFENETGYNTDITGNLFQDSGWGSGNGGCGSNCEGAVNINSSGGINVPGSNYNNEFLVSNNQFINDWMGVDIWQAGGRSCENSGEGGSGAGADAAYCSGGYPITDSAASGGQYYFSHISDSNHGNTTTLDEPVTSGSSTVEVKGALAIDDQIGFADPTSTTTTDTTNVTTFSGSGTVNVSSTTGFPASGQLRVGTSAAWSDGTQSSTGAILSYTGVSTCSGTPCFTGVSLVRGTGTLSGPILQVQPYKITAETCYANDCSLSVTPSVSTSEAAGTTVTNAGTCQLFATSVATPTSPLAPNGTSYFDGCQWISKNISVTGNTFAFEPSYIASSAPLAGGGNSTSCSAANNNACGTNFMAYQESGEAPFNTFIGGNAMLSNSLAGCPSWDSGCTSNPLSNINALSNPPSATANNDEPAGNNIWSNNSYIGPWAWNVYWYGFCSQVPTDPSTGKSMPSNACNNISFSNWQSDWQQESGSTYNPMVVSLDGITANQIIHGDQGVSTYEDTTSGSTINSTLSVGSNTAVTASPLSSSPYTFSLNTTNYTDGQYTLKVSGTDSNNNSGSDSAPVYITNGDLNGDGKVGLSDLIILAQNYGKSGTFSYNQGNITGATSGNEVNLSDLIILAKNYGYNDGLGH